MHVTRKLLANNTLKQFANICLCLPVLLYRYSTIQLLYSRSYR
jgi:hypothetical protein